MTDKINRFTKKTQQVLSRAVEEARLLNQDYVGTEHLLLGLMKDAEEITSNVFAVLDVQSALVIRTLERMMSKRQGQQVSQPALTPSTKRVIQIAVDEARNMGHHYINPDHLL